MTITTNKDKLERRCKQQEIHHKRRKLTKLQSEYKWRTISLPEIGTIYKSCVKEKVMNMEINVKAILSAFYMDTGGFDVRSFASFFWYSWRLFI